MLTKSEILQSIIAILFISLLSSCGEPENSTSESSSSSTSSISSDGTASSSSTPALSQSEKLEESLNFVQRLNRAQRLLDRKCLDPLCWLESSLSDEAATAISNLKNRAKLYGLFGGENLEQIKNAGTKVKNAFFEALKADVFNRPHSEVDGLNYSFQSTNTSNGFKKLTFKVNQDIDGIDADITIDITLESQINLISTTGVRIYTTAEPIEIDINGFLSAPGMTLILGRETESFRLIAESLAFEELNNNRSMVLTGQDISITTPITIETSNSSMPIRLMSSIKSDASGFSQFDFQSADDETEKLFSSVFGISLENMDNLQLRHFWELIDPNHSVNGEWSFDLSDYPKNNQANELLFVKDDCSSEEVNCDEDLFYWRTNNEASTDPVKLGLNAHVEGFVENKHTFDIQLSAEQLGDALHELKSVKVSQNSDEMELSVALNENHEIATLSAHLSSGASVNIEGKSGNIYHQSDTMGDINDSGNSFLNVTLTDGRDIPLKSNYFPPSDYQSLQLANNSTLIEQAKRAVSQLRRTINLFNFQCSNILCNSENLLEEQTLDAYANFKHRLKAEGILGGEDLSSIKRSLKRVAIAFIAAVRTAEHPDKTSHDGLNFNHTVETINDRVVRQFVINQSVENTLIDLQITLASTSDVTSQESDGYKELVWSDILQLSIEGSISTENLSLSINKPTNGISFDAKSVTANLYLEPSAYSDQDEEHIELSIDNGLINIPITIESKNNSEAQFNMVLFANIDDLAIINVESVENSIDETINSETIYTIASQNPIQTEITYEFWSGNDSVSGLWEVELQSTGIENPILVGHSSQRCKTADLNCFANPPQWKTLNPEALTGSAVYFRHTLDTSFEAIPPTMFNFSAYKTWPNTLIIESLNISDSLQSKSMLAKTDHTGTLQNLIYSDDNISIDIQKDSGLIFSESSPIASLQSSGDYGGFLVNYGDLTSSIFSPVSDLNEENTSDELLNAKEFFDNIINIQTAIEKNCSDIMNIFAQQLGITNPNRLSESKRVSKFIDELPQPEYKKLKDTLKNVLLAFEAALLRNMAGTTWDSSYYGIPFNYQLEQVERGQHRTFTVNESINGLDINLTIELNSERQVTGAGYDESYSLSSGNSLTLSIFGEITSTFISIKFPVQGHPNLTADSIYFELIGPGYLRPLKSFPNKIDSYFESENMVIDFPIEITNLTTSPASSIKKAFTAQTKDYFIFTSIWSKSVETLRSISELGITFQEVHDLSYGTSWSIKDRNYEQEELNYHVNLNSSENNQTSIYDFSMVSTECHNFENGCKDETNFHFNRESTLYSASYFNSNKNPDIPNQTFTNTYELSITSEPDTSNGNTNQNIIFNNTDMSFIFDGTFGPNNKAVNIYAANHLGFTYNYTQPFGFVSLNDLKILQFDRLEEQGLFVLQSPAESQESTYADVSCSPNK